MANDIKTVSLRPSEFYGDFCQRQATGPTVGRRASRKTHEDGHHTAAWAGTDNYEDAQELARVGWPEGAKRARKLADNMSAEMVASVKRPEITFDVTGDMFDMGRVIEDCPESWMQWEEGQEDGGKPVHIVYNCAVSAGVDKKIIETRGAAVCALVLVLEAAGRPCKVEIASGIADTGGFIEPRVIVKDFYDPIQVDAVAYALIHASFFRRHIFSAMEVLGVQDSWGYGMPADLRGEKGDIYLGQALLGDPAWRNVDTTMQWIRKQLELQSVQFK